MFNPFVCGSFHEEEDHHPCDHPTSSTPRRSSRSSRRSLNKNNKNPYSTRGLDKFSSLVDDLEERRQKIYQQMGSQDISFVRFVHSKADDWVPIVVKMRIHQQDNKVRLVGSKFKPVSQTNSKEAFHKFQIESPEPNNVHLQPRPVLLDERTSTAKKKSFSWNMKLMDRWGRSSNYLPIILVLILLCLVMFGRSVTILCTTCWWYLMPMIEGGHSNLRSALKKKDNATRLTEKKIASDGISSPKRKHMETIKD